LILLVVVVVVVSCSCYALDAGDLLMSNLPSWYE